MSFGLDFIPIDMSSGRIRKVLGLFVGLMRLSYLLIAVNNSQSTRVVCINHLLEALLFLDRFWLLYLFVGFNSMNWLPLNFYLYACCAFVLILCNVNVVIFYFCPPILYFFLWYLYGALLCNYLNLISFGIYHAIYLWPLLAFSIDLPICFDMYFLV